MKFAYRFAIGGARESRAFCRLAGRGGFGLDRRDVPAASHRDREDHARFARNGYQQIPLWQHVLVSVVRALAAFVVSVVVGVPLGLAMGFRR